MYFRVPGLWLTKGPVSFAHYLASASPDPHKTWCHFGCRDWYETSADATLVSFLYKRESLTHEVFYLY